MEIRAGLQSFKKFSVIFPYNEDNAGHVRGVTGLLVSQKGFVISSSRDATTRMWTKEHRKCFCHTNWITTSVFGSDSKNTVVTSSYDQTSTMLSLPDLKVLCTRTHHDDYITCSARDRDMIVTGSVDQTVVVYRNQFHPGLSFWRKMNVKHSVYSVCVLGTRGLISVGSTSPRVVLLDPRSEKCVQTWKGTSWPIKSMKVIHEGLVAAGTSEQIIVYEPRMGRPVYQFDTLENDSIWTIERVGDSSFLAAGKNGFVYHVQFAVDNEPEEKLKMTIPIQEEGSVLSMKMSNDGKAVWIGTDEGFIRKYEMPQEDSPERLVEMEVSNRTNLNYHVPNNTTFYDLVGRKSEDELSDSFQTVQILRQENCTEELPAYPGIKRVYIYPNQLDIIGWDSENTLTKWDVSTGDIVETVKCKDKVEANEKFMEFYNSAEENYVNSWFTASISTGRIMIEINPLKCFNANCVPFEAGYKLINERIILNLGELFIRAVFEGLFTITKLKCTRERDLRRLCFIDMRNEKILTMIRKLKRFAQDIKEHIDECTKHHAYITHHLSFQKEKKSVLSSDIVKIGDRLKKKGKKNPLSIPLTKDIQPMTNYSFDRNLRGFSMFSNSLFRVKKKQTHQPNPFLEDHFKKHYYDQSREKNPFIFEYFTWLMFRDFKEEMKNSMKVFEEYEKTFKSLIVETKNLKDVMLERYELRSKIPLQDLKDIEEYFETKLRKGIDLEYIQKKKFADELRGHELFEQYLKKMVLCERHIIPINKRQDKFFNDLHVKLNNFIQTSKISGYPKRVPNKSEKFYQEFYSKYPKGKEHDYHYYFYNQPHPSLDREKMDEYESSSKKRKIEKKGVERFEVQHDPFSFPVRYYTFVFERVLEKHLIWEGNSCNNITKLVEEEIRMEEKRIMKPLPLYHGGVPMMSYSLQIFNIKENENTSSKNQKKKEKSSKSTKKKKGPIIPIPTKDLIWKGQNVRFVEERVSKGHSQAKSKPAKSNFHLSSSSSDEISVGEISRVDIVNKILSKFDLKKDFLTPRLLQVLGGIQKLNEITFVEGEKLHRIRKRLQFAAQKLSKNENNSSPSTKKEHKARNHNFETGAELGDIFSNPTSPSFEMMANERIVEGYIDDESYMQREDLYQNALLNYRNTMLPHYVELDESIPTTWNRGRFDEEIQPPIVTKHHKFDFSWSLNPNCRLVVGKDIHLLRDSSFKGLMEKEKSSMLSPFLLTRNERIIEFPVTCDGLTFNSENKLPYRRFVVEEEVKKKSEAETFLLDWVVEVLSKGVPREVRLRNRKIQFFVGSLDEGLPDIMESEEFLFGLASLRLSDIAIYVFEVLRGHNVKFPSKSEWEKVKKEYEIKQEKIDELRLQGKLEAAEALEKDKREEEIKIFQNLKRSVGTRRNQTYPLTPTTPATPASPEKNFEFPVVENPLCEPHEYLEFVSSSQNEFIRKVLDPMMNLQTINKFYLGTNRLFLKIYYRRKYIYVNRKAEREERKRNSRKKK